MKKWKSAVLILLAVLLLSPYVLGIAFFVVMGIVSDDRADKTEIIAYVEENRADLLTYIQKEDFSALDGHPMIKKIDADDDMVDFYCGGAGFGSATAYCGFYYTAEDDIRAIWCAPKYGEKMIECGDGFLWQQEDGDNQYYTEEICDGFYYYEASY